MDGLQLLESKIKMPLMELPVRSTFVKLNSAGVLISPGSRLSESQLMGLPTVTDLVAPNLFHCAGIRKASQSHPHAQRWAPLGGIKSKPEIAWSFELGAAVWPYTQELPMVALQGMPKVNETLFVHKKSKSLIVTDLCFNLTEPKGMGSWIILNLFGTYKKFATSRFFTNFIFDKKAFSQSLAEVFSHDFENIIVSHGENVIGNGKEILQKSLAARGLIST